MSSRELKALLADKPEKSLSRTRSGAARADMSEERMKELEAALEAAQQKIQKQSSELEAAGERNDQYEAQLKELETELERHKLTAEVEMLRAVEKVREQERQHLQEWAEDIKEKHRVEKKALEERVAILEAEKTSGAKSPTSASLTGSSASTPSTAAGTSSAGSAAATTVTSSPATSGDSTIATTSPLISLATTTTATTVTPTTAITTTPSTGVSAASAPITVTSGGAETTVTSAITGTEMITRLFEAQTQLFAAQVQAATLPPLTNFEGQNAADDDDGFERWLEKFEERAKLAKWTDEVKLCQLKLHLVKTADQVFRALALSKSQVTPLQ